MYLTLPIRLLFNVHRYHEKHAAVSPFETRSEMKIACACGWLIMNDKKEGGGTGGVGPERDLGWASLSSPGVTLGSPRPSQ